MKIVVIGGTGKSFLMNMQAILAPNWKTIPLYLRVQARLGKISFKSWFEGQKKI